MGYKGGITLADARRRFEAEVLVPAGRSHAILGYRTASVRFKIRALARRWYLPDFLVVCGAIPGFVPHCRLCCVEVKGFLAEEPGILAQCAAEAYPEFGWLLVDLADPVDGWRAFRVTGRGLTPNPCRIAWIHGG